MPKNKKHQWFMIFLLTLLFALVSIGTGIFVGSAKEIKDVLPANAISSQGKQAVKVAVKRKKRPSAWRNLLKESENQPERTVNCDYAAPQKPDYKGEFIALETKVSVAAEEEFQTALFLKNTGNTAWFGDASGCANQPAMRLGTARGKDRASAFFNPGDTRWIGPNRIAMMEKKVEPGEVATFAFSGRGADADDIFRDYFQPVLEGKKWMERREETAHLDVHVGNVTGEHERQLFYMGHSGRVSTLDLSGRPVAEVDISDQKLQLKFGDHVIREYMVSTGTFRMPTPLGRFSIINKQELRIGSKRPYYRMPMWQGFTKGGAGFHALPYLANDNGVFWKEALNHIGQRVSHGCVRLLNEDAEDFFGLTEVGMEVLIKA